MNVYFEHPRLEDLHAVSALLCAERILFDPVAVDGNHQYELVNYFIHDFDEIYCLLDRNIVSDLIALVRGADVATHPAGKSIRLVAGLQAFLNAARIESEPSIAYHELIDSQGIEAADAELALFRSADNLDPELLLDIAIGKRSIVPRESVAVYKSGELLSASLPERLRPFERNIVIIRKALSIRRSVASDYEAMIALTDWLYYEYFFTAPSLAFLSLYFSNGRIRGMLKSHQPKDVRNAAWDLCFLQEWASATKRNPKVKWLAATRDRAMKQVARIMFPRFDESDTAYANRLETEYSRIWTAKERHGQALLDRLAKYTAEIDSHVRKCSPGDAEYIKRLSQSVEEEYLRRVVNEA